MSPSPALPLPLPMTFPLVLVGGHCLLLWTLDSGGVRAGEWRLLVTSETHSPPVNKLTFSRLPCTRTAACRRVQGHLGEEGKERVAEESEGLRAGEVTTHTHWLLKVDQEDARK